VIRDRSDPPTPAAPDPATPSQGAGSFFRPRYLPWAKLIARVFEADAVASAWAASLARESEVLVCAQCGGTAQVIAATAVAACGGVFAAAVTPPSVIRAILNSLGLSPRAPPIAPAPPTSQVLAQF
jgi:hypothetical protein